MIVEGFIRFDYEITLLTVRHAGGTSFCAPIGHLQVDGDYRESLAAAADERARRWTRPQRIARTVTDNLGGAGIFGVELFVRGDDVWFSEVSPRPHDTGLVTLVSQDLSRVRAARARDPRPAGAGDPPGRAVRLLRGAARGRVARRRFHGVEQALAEPDTQLRLFGKPEVHGKRRMGVTLARGDTSRAGARQGTPRGGGHRRAAPSSAEPPEAADSGRAGRQVRSIQRNLLENIAIFQGINKQSSSY